MVATTNGQIFWAKNDALTEKIKPERFCDSKTLRVAKTFYAWAAGIFLRNIDMSLRLL